MTYSCSLAWKYAGPWPRCGHSSLSAVHGVDHLQLLWGETRKRVGSGRRHQSNSHSDQRAETLGTEVWLLLPGFKPSVLQESQRQKLPISVHCIDGEAIRCLGQPDTEDLYVGERRWMHRSDG
jgi:hypothetical protein